MFNGFLADFHMDCTGPSSFGYSLYFERIFMLSAVYVTRSGSVHLGSLDPNLVFPPGSQSTWDFTFESAS